MNDVRDFMRAVPNRGRRRSRSLVFVALVCLGVLALLPMAGSGVAAEPSGRADLKKAIVTEMLGQEEGRAFSYSAAEETQNTQANVKRISDDGRWAFGTAVIEAPKKEGAHPEGSLFVARKAGGDWNVGLEGSSEFSELAGEAPEAVVGEDEKESFTATSSTRSTQAVNMRLQLPWKKGLLWTMTGGPHGWATGYDRPYSSLDFNGTGGKVVAARAGRAYTMCSSNRGWIRVVHANGLATDYYHLRGNINRGDGSRVNTGSFLGYTGQDVSCGGAAYGDHVHFSLLRYGKRITLDDKIIGGWTFNVGTAYEGYAQRSGIRRYAGDPLRNFGLN